MARLTAAARREIPRSEFAIPSKAPGPGSYPLPDKAHGRAALRLASKAGSNAGKVRAAVHRRFPSIGKMDSGKATPLSEMA